MSASPPSPNSQASPAPWEGVLDREALARLHELDPSGKTGLVARVVSTYRSSLRKLRGQFDEARAVRDPAALRHVAHTLKSSSASVGALELSAICAQVERRLREAGPDGALAAIETEIAALVAEAARIQAVLDAQSGGPAS